MASFDTIRSRVEVECNDPVTDSLTSGASVVLRSDNFCYKVRGLTPGVFGPVTFVRSQELTCFEYARLQQFEEDAVPAELIFLTLDEGEYAVLRTRRLESLQLGGDASGIEDISQWIRDVFARRAQPTAPSSTEPVLGHLEKLLDELGTSVPAGLREFGAEVLAVLRNLPVADKFFLFHGDLRISNMGTLGGDLKLFDPAVAPHLLATTALREMSALWASHILHSASVPSEGEFERQWGRANLAEAKNWICFNMLHRTLLTLTSGSARTYDPGVESALHVDDLMQVSREVMQRFE